MGSAVTDREWREANPDLWRKQTARIRVFGAAMLAFIGLALLLERLF